MIGHSQSRPVHPMADLLSRLKQVRRSGDSWTALCPSHDDHENSLSIAARDGKWLIKCHAGCDWSNIIGVLGLQPSDLFENSSQEERKASYPSSNRATVQPRPGLTLEQYAAAKKLPVNFLKGCGLSEITYEGASAVRMPYLDPWGETHAVRFRIALDGDRFRWKSGAKPCLYGLSRLADARTAGEVVLVEGESDCHTLWSHGIPAVGLPGATNWREDRDAQHFDGIEKIYAIVEPDRGGESVRKWLARSIIRARTRLVSLATKDPSALHIDNPDLFKPRWQVACLGALPWSAAEDRANAEDRAEAWEKCAELAQAPRILDLFDRELSTIGMVGERRGAKLVYLALTSRLLERPVSVAVKGPSSGGKSFLVESTLKFFPSEAYHALTAMSERALAYSTEPLQHRFLVIYEAAGMSSDFASYLIRSLLSEGRLRYETVEKTKAGLVPRIIEREGPTGLIVTTTSVSLHPENETRMVSLGVTETREQTAAVFQALAQETKTNAPDITAWHSLQRWLATGRQQVSIPFAAELAKLVPPVAVRLRRDFKTVLSLIKAHALLHQSSRVVDENERIVATLEDYAQVRVLVAELVAEGVEAKIKPEVREVVETVARLLPTSDAAEVRQSQIAKALRLDKSVISRRVAVAINAGILRNIEDRKGRPARLVLGDPLPEELEVLPQADRLHGCAVGVGDTSPSPRPGQENGPSYRCAKCGDADRPGDPLIPFGVEPDHSWQHSGCWRTQEGST